MTIRDLAAAAKATAEYAWNAFLDLELITIGAIFVGLVLFGFGPTALRALNDWEARIREKYPARIRVAKWVMVIACIIGYAAFWWLVI
jgi:hypothetical protein